MKRSLPLLPGITLIVLGVILIVYLKSDEPPFISFNSETKITCLGSEAITKPNKVQIDMYGRLDGDITQTRPPAKVQYLAVFTILESGEQFVSHSIVKYKTDKDNGEETHTYYKKSRGIWRKITTKKEFFTQLIKSVPPEYIRDRGGAKIPSEMDKDVAAYLNLWVNCGCPIHGIPNL